MTIFRAKSSADRYGHHMSRWLVAFLVTSSSLASAQPTPEELDRAGVTDPLVRAAMQKVRRADFLPEEQKKYAREDRPLPIGYGQTTSQPTLIAQMIQQLNLQPGCKVLEVGTGSGYQTAILAELCDEVASVEILSPLAQQARKRLRALGYRNISIRVGDGYLGWKRRAPFDAITVGAGVVRIPPPLVSQLAVGGRLVVPVGEWWAMQLYVLTKRPDGGVTIERSLGVGFVPLLGPRADEDRS